MPSFRTVVAALAGAAALIGLLSPQVTTPLARRPAERVVVLGFDGASLDLIEPLVAEGKLPALASLMRRGAYGRLRTFQPVKSAILWTSIATGKTMLKHGIVDWTFVDAAGIQRPFDGSARRARTYWEILDREGVSTGTIGWWLTYPPPPLQHGFLVSDAFRAIPEARALHPPDLVPALRRILPRPRDVRQEWEGFDVLDYRPDAVTIPLRSMSETTIKAFRGYLLLDLTVDRISDELWRQRPVEVFSTYFRFIDVASHFGLHFVDRSVYERTLALEQQGSLDLEALHNLDRAMARVLLPVYRLMDHIVAKYLTRLDRRTLLIICSDHGFGWYRGSYTHYQRGQDPPYGVIFLAGPGVRAGYRLQGVSLLDIAPTLLHAIGRPTAADMDGVVIDRAFDPAWRQRFPVRTRPTYEDAAIQARGTAERDKALDQKVLQDLRALGYLDTGEGETPRR